MRIWTVQDKAAYDCLCENGVLRCESSLAEWLREENFKRAYDWLVSEMKERIGEPPASVEYPIWAWYLLDGRNVKPDLRRTEFRNYEGENYIIEAEIPDGEILLSDEETWHFVLNDWYLHAYENDGEWEAENEWFNALPVNDKERVKLESWKRIFDSGDDCNSWRFVQATFWELRKERIVSVRKFIGKMVKQGGKT